MASNSVLTAMVPSENIISFLRSYLSAQTPAKGETNSSGSKLQAIEIVMYIPDFVVSVIYQVIANCTSAEPKREIDWLPMNTPAFFFQFVACIGVPFPSLVAGFWG